MEKTDVLDHGYLGLVGHWGSDEQIIEAARMSTDGGFVSWEPYDGHPKGDAGLLRYLYEHKHSTPFEMAGLTIEVQAPIFIFRQWHRHRTQCLAGDTMVHFQRPDNGRVYKMPIAEVWRKWQPTRRADRPERQSNAFWNRSRIEDMALRCVNEDAIEVELTRVTGVVKSPAKQLYGVTTIGGRSIRASFDHRFFTDQGWLRLEDAVSRGASLAVETTAKSMAEGWEVDAIDYSAERWRDVVGWEGLYEVSNLGRVRRCGKPPRRTTVGRQGYPVVSLNRPGMQCTRTVHALVLEAWHGPRPEGWGARHLNSNRLDPRASNLRWGTAQENAQDRLRRGSQQCLGVIFEEIQNCIPAGIEETFDLSVEGPWHNFIADGMCVHNSYNEMSARYTPMPEADYLPDAERCIVVNGKNKQARGASQRTPTHEEVLDWLEQLEATYRRSQRVYDRGLAIGIPKEIARLPVPVARYSRMRASANLRNWLAFLTLRMDSHAQWEIQQYANVVGGLIEEAFPRTWELFVEGMS